MLFACMHSQDTRVAGTLCGTGETAFCVNHLAYTVGPTCEC